MQRYIIIFFTAFSSFLYSQNSVQKAIDLFVCDKINAHASISFMAIDLESGNEIAQTNGNLSITSASVAKLFSTATAFELLGKDFTTETRFYADGIVTSDSVLHGNLWIRGGGDVTLGSRFFNPDESEFSVLVAWSDSLKSKGINRIEGAIIADGSEFGYKGVPDGWNWADVGNYYGAGAAGINFYDNQIKFKFKTGKVGELSQIHSIFPEIPNLEVKNNVIAANVSDDNSYVFGAPFSLERMIQGKLPANQTSFEVKGSMPDPEFQLAHEFCKILKSKGIYVEKAAKGYRTLDIDLKPDYTDKFKLLFSQPSKTVQQIAYWTNLRSVNLYAEGLLNLVGYAKTGDGSTESGLKQMEAYWGNKIDLSGLSLKDGSGLSRSNAMSAHHFCQLLKVMYQSSNFTDFKNTLPVAGQSGTARSLCKGEAGEGRVFAKSGTINKVKAYAGYVDSKSGKKIAFSISVNNFEGSNSELIQKMEKVLNALASY
ncbi:MAG: D-alanyl-D-alanine carboxypeptidase/D-alanyl-D-alanine-endopeptidase [Crocinitomicaceae bacterium]|nr:D-alanyl-D-alanine carboxypeptidase/D-alanyl-D-alanine-endopeptidase [Crocinitomicaceae bacterium]